MLTCLNQRIASFECRFGRDRSCHGKVNLLLARCTIFNGGMKNLSQFHALRLNVVPGHLEDRAFAVQIGNVVGSGNFFLFARQ
jgi:hypothetical protein